MAERKKKALITGVTGQDGAYISKLLLDKGYDVYGIVRRVSTPNFWRLQYLDILNKITLISADLSDMASLSEAIHESNPDEIYNLAAQSFVGSSFDQPIQSADINGLALLKILEIVRKFNPKIKIYQASTSELYGDSHNLHGEDKSQNELTPFKPNSPYALSKLFAFELARIYRESYGIFVANGILFNHECISENTPVIVRNKETKIISIKRVKDIRRPREKSTNEQQWAINNLEIWDGDNFVELRFLTATKRRKNDENFNCKIMNTRNGVVETTNHHTMIYNNNEKTKAQHINIEDKLLHKLFPNSEEISYLSKEEALFLGMMVGGGYIGLGGKSKFVNNDNKVMELFISLWKKIALGSVKIKIYKTEFGFSKQANLSRNASYLRLIKNEIYTHDSYKKVPDRVLNANKEIQLAFLTGYNITDGLKSNPCIYEFKNFKTNSIILAQGLLFLISQTTKQKFNITFENDEKYYGYYSINLLSPTDNKLKEEQVKILLTNEISQRQISRDTGFSRNFIRRIQRGEQIQLSHHLSKDKTEVKKILYHRKQPEWVFDIATSSGKFMAGVGNIVIANSPLRGLEFVTRKITNEVAKIKLGLSNEIRLGNLEARRDWGYAVEYVELMWKILQHSKPEDFVIATNETHSVKEFVEEAFKAAGLDWKLYVRIDEQYKRPYEVPYLKGDYSKAKNSLGWVPKITFKELVKIMVEADLDRWKRYLNGEHFAWDAPNHPGHVKYLFRAKDK